jgi:hypothetical protein
MEVNLLAAVKGAQATGASPLAICTSLPCAHPALLLKKAKEQDQWQLKTN